MKLLYFLDFDYFEKYGKSVSGDEDLRFDNGPIPRMAEKMLKEMNGRDIKITKIKIGSGYNDQQRIEALRDFDVNLFFRDIDLCSIEIDFFCKFILFRRLSTFTFCMDSCWPEK